MNGSVLCHCLRLAALAVPVRRALSEEQRQREAVAAKREAELKERYAKLLKRQKDRARREEVKAKRACPPAFLTGI